jgi:hypothetical protein
VAGDSRWQRESVELRGFLQIFNLMAGKGGKSAHTVDSN